MFKKTCLFPKKIVKLLLLFFTVFLFSCSNRYYRSDVKTLDTSGQLSHTQYWNKYDSWDLNGLFVIATFLDDSKEEISFKSEAIQYVCSPSTPIDGTEELVISNIFYIDSSSTKHFVKDEMKCKVKIIDYPYDFAKIDIRFIIFPLIIVVVLVIFIIMFIAKKNKKKKGYNCK